MEYFYLSYLYIRREKERTPKGPKYLLIYSKLGVSINLQKVLRVQQELTQQQQGRVGSCVRYAHA